MNWRKLIDVDFPNKLNIKEEAKENLKKFYWRKGYRINVRDYSWEYPTDKKYEENRKKSLSTKLP